MKFSLFKEYGALNSKPIFEAFEHSLRTEGYDVYYNSMDADVAVIWSVLFNGRMSGNRVVWEQYRQSGKNVVVLEVGGIKRGTTWKVGLNGINRDAYFGKKGKDNTRADSFGLNLKPWSDTGEYILLCGQHEKSEQWRKQLPMSQWVMNIIEELRLYTDRPIVFRPHPRCRLPAIEHQYKNVFRQEPVKLTGTYDDFDMNFKNVFATISYSSNPGIHSVIQGVPAFVSNSSLAYDVGNDIDFIHTIENPLKPDRQQWVNDYAWTEYTVKEIMHGIPLKRLTSKL